MKNNSSRLGLIQDHVADGAYHMAYDESLLRHEIAKKGRDPVLRFYRFKEDTMTVGYGMWSCATSSQALGEFSSSHGALRGPVPLVRRLTGGGIVYHTPSDLTYSLILPANCKTLGWRVLESYSSIHQALKSALSHFGIDTQYFVPNEPKRKSGVGISFCFDVPVLYDLMLGGRKVAGAGQKRTAGYLLHQGAIAWGYLTEHKPNVSRVAFQKRFAACIGTLLDLPTKEIPFSAEEINVPHCV